MVVGLFAPLAGGKNCSRSAPGSHFHVASNDASSAEGAARDRDCSAARPRSAGVFHQENTAVDCRSQTLDWQPSGSAESETGKPVRTGIFMVLPIVAG
jgi:hypothetical protein